MTVESKKTALLYCILGDVIILLASFIYLLFDDSVEAKEFVTYLIGVCEIAIIIFAALIFYLNRKHG